MRTAEWSGIGWKTITTPEDFCARPTHSDVIKSYPCTCIKQISFMHIFNFSKRQDYIFWF